jgi:polar amino acid transport system substrate-binding protein
MKRSIVSAMVCITFVLCIPALLCAAGTPKELTASLAQIPGLADSPDKGSLVDLVKAIADATGTKIKIEVYPFARSIDNVVKGKADFHLPTVRNCAVSEAGLPYRFTTERTGTVSFVIYSNAEKPITKKMLSDAAAQKGKFPYNIEVPAGIDTLFGFPAHPSNDVANSLEKVRAKRIDALVWAQEETDSALKKLKIKSIKRDFWADYDDTILLSKGPKGEAADAILSAGLKKLKASKQLDQIHSKVHHPYDSWQPADMGW